ncbi:MAG TPA: hypothetical protein VFP44_24640 [Usitatibacter sp.]|nr:hypothetical protein [Usitatibacter sp.]
MREVPKQHEPEIGGGTVYEPWCPPLDEPGYPTTPGCPTDPPAVEPGYVDPTATVQRTT